MRIKGLHRVYTFSSRDLAMLFVKQGVAFGSVFGIVFEIVFGFVFGSVNRVVAQDLSPLVHLSFNDETIVNLGTYELGDLAFSGSSPQAYVSTGIFYPNGQEIKTIKLDGTNYVGTTTTTVDLGIAGASPKTVSAIFKSDSTGNRGLWQIGTNTTSQDFTIKLTNNSTLTAQLWANDHNTTSPVSITDNWGLISETYDGTTVRVYYNGAMTGSKAVALNTGNSQVRLGYWASESNSFQGGIGEFKIFNDVRSSAQIRQEAQSLGGCAYMFNDSAKWEASFNPDGGWISGCGNNMFAITAGYNNSIGKALLTYPSALTGRNQDGVTNSDDYTGILWGNPFTVVDDTKEITLRISGGTFGLPAMTDGNGGTNLSALRGKAGFVLYDKTEGKFLLDTYRCHSDTSSAWEEKKIPLTGLAGHTLAMAVVDFATGSWGMTAVESINIPLGTANFMQETTPVAVVKSFNFDNVGNWEGWYEVDGDGNRLPEVTNFRFGAPSACNFSIGGNFITSNKDAWDVATGTLRSEEFKITGDIIEFMINGGYNTGDYGFSLFVQQENEGEFIKLLTAQRPNESSNNFIYDFWDVQEYKGKMAYLQLHDNATSNWGWIGIDNIQMVEFNQLPEPATWLMLLLGCAGIVGVWHKRGKKDRFHLPT